MHKESCLICKFHGKKSNLVTENYLFQNASVQCIHLCWGHSVELFKMGQTNFLTKYHQGFTDHGLDPERFFEKKSYYQFSNFR